MKLNLRTLSLLIIFIVFSTACGFLSTGVGQEKKDNTPPHVGAFIAEGDNFIELTEGKFIRINDNQPLIIVWYPEINLSYLTFTKMGNKTEVTYTAIPKGEIYEFMPKEPLPNGEYCLIQGGPLVNPSEEIYWCFKISDSASTPQDSANESTENSADQEDFTGSEEQPEIALPDFCQNSIRLEIGSVHQDALYHEDERCYIFPLEAHKIYYLKINITNAAELFDIYPTNNPIHIPYRIYAPNGEPVYQNLLSSKVPTPKGDIENEFSVAKIIPEMDGDYYLVHRTSSSLYDQNPKKFFLQLTDDKTVVAKGSFEISKLGSPFLPYLQLTYYYVELLDDVVRVHFEAATNEQWDPEETCLISGSEEIHPLNVDISESSEERENGYIEYKRNPDLLDLTPYVTDLYCDGRYQTNLFNELAVIPGVWESVNQQIESPGLNKVTILPYCDLISSAEKSFTTNDSFVISWSLVSQTDEQMVSMLQSANFEILVDGIPIESYEVLETKELDGDPYYNYYTGFTYDFGKLNIGEHIIEINILWNDLVSNGVSTFGPGGEFETEHNTCTIFVK